MMKRGFTLIELMFASAISAIVMTALIVMFSGLMTVVKGASDELQAVLKARAQRERLFYNALPTSSGGVTYGGLLSARNVRISENQIVADYRFTSENGNPAWLLDQLLPDTYRFETDASLGPTVAHVSDAGILYAYLVVEMGDRERFLYKDRLVVPLTGYTQTAPTTLECGPLDEDSSYYNVSDKVWGGTGK